MRQLRSSVTLILCLAPLPDHSRKMASRTTCQTWMFFRDHKAQRIGIQASLQKISTNCTPGGSFFAWCQVYYDNLPVSISVNTLYCQHTTTHHITTFSDVSVAGIYNQKGVCLNQCSLLPLVQFLVQGLCHKRDLIFS
jgi:hypothetical protein